MPRVLPAAVLLSCFSLAGLSPAQPAVELPSEGRCPPYPLPPGQATQAPADAVPPDLRPGQRIELEAMPRIAQYLPPEVWERRDVFFYEGQELEVGPCHRRYAMAPLFEAATQASAGQARVDAAGNLEGYSGAGLPFVPAAITRDDPTAGARWAWNYRYRYLGSGFRGDFVIWHVRRRGRSSQKFVGRQFVQPFYGVPSLVALDDRRSFAAGGEFTAPQIARGLAWRQFRPANADTAKGRSDDVFVWLPSSRRVKRAPPFGADGFYVPNYTQARGAGNETYTLPDASGSIDLSQASLDPFRKGFVGLMLRPNDYTWTFEGVRDVLAPLNVRELGRASEPQRAYGPSGLSIASERWDLRRAVVLHGVLKSPQLFRELTLYVDAQTQHPLYLISRKAGGRMFEVGVFAGRFTGDDPLAPHWEGAGNGFGTILPVAQTFWVAGGESWMRESFDLESRPPEGAELKDLLTTRRLGRHR